MHLTVVPVDVKFGRRWQLHVPKVLRRYVGDGATNGTAPVAMGHGVNMLQTGEAEVSNLQ